MKELEQIIITEPTEEELLAIQTANELAKAEVTNLISERWDTADTMIGLAEELRDKYIIEQAIHRNIDWYYDLVLEYYASLTPIIVEPIVEPIL